MIDYKNISDLELAHLLKSDDHKAFEEILKRYSPILVNFSYRKVYDVQLAQDLVHDVITELWEKRAQYAYTYGFEAFIMNAMWHRILGHFRREKINGRYLDYFRASFTDETDPTDYQARYNDMNAWIEREIAALPNKLRVVFELRRKSNMSRKEIAEYLQIPENTIKTQMQFALRILKKRLKDAFVFFLY